MGAPLAFSIDELNDLLGDTKCRVTVDIVPQNRQLVLRANMDTDRGVQVVTAFFPRLVRSTGERSVLVHQELVQSEDDYGSDRSRSRSRSPRRQIGRAHV